MHKGLNCSPAVSQSVSRVLRNPAKLVLPLQPLAILYKSFVQSAIVAPENTIGKLVASRRLGIPRTSQSKGCPRIVQAQLGFCTRATRGKEVRGACAKTDTQGARARIVGFITAGTETGFGSFTMGVSRRVYTRNAITHPIKRRLRRGAKGGSGGSCSGKPLVRITAIDGG